MTDNELNYRFNQLYQKITGNNIPNVDFTELHVVPTSQQQIFEPTGDSLGFKRVTVDAASGGAPEYLYVLGVVELAAPNSNWSQVTFTLQNPNDLQPIYSGYCMDMNEGNLVEVPWNQLTLGCLYSSQPDKIFIYDTGGNPYIPFFKIPLHVEGSWPGYLAAEIRCTATDTIGIDYVFYNTLYIQNGDNANKFPVKLEYERAANGNMDLHLWYSQNPGSNWAMSTALGGYIGYWFELPFQQ